MYCTAGTSTASSSKTPVPVCKITDGSAANEEMCQCSPGTICSSTTGLICYTLHHKFFFSRNGEGTCRKSHPGPFTYINDKQSCGVATKIIQVQEECEVAVVIAGETAKSCSDRSPFTASCVKLMDRGAGQDRISHLSNVPAGCSWQLSGGVWFNTYFDSTTSCGSGYSDGGCLCKASTDCVHRVRLMMLIVCSRWIPVPIRNDCHLGEIRMFYLFDSFMLC